MFANGSLKHEALKDVLSKSGKACHKTGIGVINTELKSGTFNLENLFRMLFIERFNRSYRTEVLDARIFNNLIKVREITSD